MISEYFLNQCIEMLVSLRDDYPERKSIFKDMYDVIKIHYEDIEENDELQPSFKRKVELVKYFSQFRHRERKFEFNKLKDRLMRGKFKDEIPIMESLFRSLSDDEVRELRESILLKKKLISLLKGKSSLKQILEDIDSGNFIDDEEAINKWEAELLKNYKNYSDIKKSENIDKAAILNLLEDNYESVFDSLQNVTTDIIPTGYDIIDKNLCNHGLERRRLYLFGGTSGVGKSALLVNILCNVTKRDFNLNKNMTNRKDYDTYIYFTAENLVDETLIRFYCCMFDMSQSEFLRLVMEDPEFKERCQKDLSGIFEKYHTSVIIIYVEAKTTTLYDLEMYISNLKEQGYNIKGIFVDYIDLLTMSSDYKREWRFELGDMAQGLKNMAIDYDLASVTVTQLNDSGYNKEGAADLRQISESKLKINPSDFIGFMQLTDTDIATNMTVRGLETGTNIKFTIVKNRNGKKNVSSSFIMPSECGGKDIFSYKICELPKSITNMEDTDSLVDMSVNFLDKFGISML